MQKERIDNMALVLFENICKGHGYRNQSKIEVVDEQLASEGYSPIDRSQFWRDTRAQLSRTRNLREAQGARALLVVTKQTEEMIDTLTARLERQRDANVKGRSGTRNSTQANSQEIND